MSNFMERALAKRVLQLSVPETVDIEKVSPNIMSGVKKALLSGETHYTERPGIKELREKVALKLSVKADQVVITNGEKEARFVAKLALNKITDDIIFGDFDDVDGISSFRVGFVAGPRDKIMKIRSLKQALSICTAAPSQRAVILSLSS